MGVRVVFPDMGKDPSIQLIEKTITENGTYDAITDGANGYSKVNVNVEGGGGGESDFSTAEVTVSLNTDSFYIGNAVVIFDDEMQIPEVFTSGNYTIVLYKGSCEGQINAPEGYRTSNATGTGGVTVTDTPFGFRVNITGDGTLTVDITRA